MRIYYFAQMIATERANLFELSTIKAAAKGRVLKNPIFGAG